MNSSIEKVGKQKCPMWVHAWVYMWECVPVWRMSSGGNSGPAYQAIFCSLLWHLIPICKSALGWRCGWKKAPHPHSSTSAPWVCTTPSSTARRGKQRRLTKRCGQVTTLLWVVLQLCVLCILGQKWSVKAPHSNPVLSWFYDRLRKKTPSRPPCKVGPEPSILMAYNHIRFSISLLLVQQEPQWQPKPRGYPSWPEGESAPIVAMFLFRTSSLHWEQRDFLKEDYKCFHLPLNGILGQGIWFQTSGSTKTNRPNYYWFVIVSLTVGLRTRWDSFSFYIYGHSWINEIPRGWGICLPPWLLTFLQLYVYSLNAAILLHIFSIIPDHVCYLSISFKMKCTWKTLK